MITYKLYVFWLYVGYINKKIDELHFLLLFTKLTQPSVCLNQGWSKACWAVILSDEFFSNSLFIRS